MSDASNESPARPLNELPLSPLAYYDSIPLTAQLPLDVAREVLREATIRHEEEPLPVSPRTGLNVLRNSQCTTSDAVEVAEGFAATIKNRESFHQLRILLLQTQITRLQRQPEQRDHDDDRSDTDRPRSASAPARGLQAERLRYRGPDQKAKAINDSISNLEAEVSGVLAEQRLALGRLEGARAATRLGHVRLGAGGPRKTGRVGWRHPDTRVSWGNERGRSG